MLPWASSGIECVSDSLSFQVGIALVQIRLLCVQDIPSFRELTVFPLKIIYTNFSCLQNLGMLFFIHCIHLILFQLELLALFFSTNLLHSAMIIDQTPMTRRCLAQALAQQFFGCFISRMSWWDSTQWGCQVWDSLTGRYVLWSSFKGSLLIGYSHCQSERACVSKHYSASARKETLK